MAIQITDIAYRMWRTLVRDYGYERRKAVEWMLYVGALQINSSFEALNRVRESKKRTVYVKQNVEDVFAVKREQEPKRKRHRIEGGTGSYIRYNNRYTGAEKRANYIYFPPRQTERFMSRGYRWYTIEVNPNGVFMIMSVEKKDGYQPLIVTKKNAQSEHAYAYKLANKKNYPVCDILRDALHLDTDHCDIGYRTLSEGTQNAVLELHYKTATKQAEMNFNN